MAAPPNCVWQPPGCPPPFRILVTGRRARAAETDHYVARAIIAPSSNPTDSRATHQTLQVALEAFPNGGLFYLLEGDHLVEGLTVPTNVRITGAGEKSVIKPTGAPGILLTFSGGNNGVDQVRFDGLNQVVTAMHIGLGSNYKFKNFSVTGFTGPFITLGTDEQSGPSDLEFDNTMYLGNGQGVQMGVEFVGNVTGMSVIGSTFINLQYGIADAIALPQFTVTNLLVEDCRFRGQAVNDIRLVQFNGVLIDGNEFVGPNILHAIDVGQGTNGQISFSFGASNNVFKGKPAVVMILIRTWWLLGNSLNNTNLAAQPPAFFVSTSSDGTMSHNQVTVEAGPGANSSGFSLVSCTEVAVHGNLVRQTSADGIVCSSCERITIVGNTIVNTGSVGVGAGIRFIGGARSTIQGNTVLGCANDNIRVGEGVASTEMTICGNVSKSSMTGNGIDINASRVTANCNVVCDNFLADMTWNVDDGTHSSSGNIRDAETNQPVATAANAFCTVN